MCGGCNSWVILLGSRLGKRNCGAKISKCIKKTK
jgi:hypothetical protein